MGYLHPASPPSTSTSLPAIDLLKEQGTCPAEWPTPCTWQLAPPSVIFIPSGIRKPCCSCVQESRLPIPCLGISTRLQAQAQKLPPPSLSVLLKRAPGTSIWPLLHSALNHIVVWHSCVLAEVPEGFPQEPAPPPKHQDSRGLSVGIRSSDVSRQTAGW